MLRLKFAAMSIKYLQPPDMRSCNRAGLCRIQYDTGEIEELDLTEVIHDEQMFLLE